MNIIDRFYSWSDPEKALKRQVARARLSVFNKGYSHHGASKRKNSLKGWNSSSGDADEDIVENLETLRERARDLFMGGSPLVSGAVKTIRTNVVGPGLSLNPSIDYEFLGMDKAKAQDWQKNVKREWKLWADSKDCDASRTMNFGQMQSVAIISAINSGDVFAILPIIKRKGSVYDLRVSLVEGDRVANPTLKAKYTDNVLGGIKCGEWGEPESYFIWKYHPYTHPFYKNGTKNSYKEIPAFGSRSGRRNVLHVFQDMERPGQRRGVPLASVALELSKQLGRYTESEIMNHLVKSFFTVFIETATPENPLGESISADERIDDDDENTVELGSGNVVGLGEGEKANVAQANASNSSFDGFVQAISRQMGASMEIPFEVFQKHFTASYSASRAALLEVWKMYKMRRSWLISDFCQPIYEEWLTEAIEKGRIVAPGFFNDPAVRAAWCRAEWFGPTQGQLNPVQEANASKILIDADLTTREKESAELRGLDWDMVLPIRIEEERKRREGGLSVALEQPVSTVEPNSDEVDK